MDEPKWRTWWEKHADPETFLQEQSPRTWHVRKIVYAMMKNILKRGDTVLDVGCGAAVDYEPIRDMGFDWSGVDMTESFVRHVLKKYDGTAKIYHRDASQPLRLKRQRFTLTYAKHLFEHLPPDQWKKIVKEMWRMSAHYMLLAFFHPPDSHPTDYHIVTEKENKLTYGVYSNHYNKEEWVEFLQSLNSAYKISVKESVIYKKQWKYPKGYSVWLIERRRRKENDSLE